MERLEVPKAIMVFFKSKRGNRKIITGIFMENLVGIVLFLRVPQISNGMIYNKKVDIIRWIIYYGLIQMSELTFRSITRNAIGNVS